MADKPTNSDSKSGQQSSNADPSSVDSIITDALIDRNLHDGDGDPADIGAALPFVDVAGTLEPEDWKPPFFLRYRIPVLVGILTSLGWGYLVDQVVELYLGWNNLTVLLPHELGGLAVGIITPLALLWMVVAFFERGRTLRHETEALRWQLSQLAYPSDRAEIRLRDVTQSLRRQAQELVTSSDRASARAEDLSDTLRDRSQELSDTAREATERTEYTTQIFEERGTRFADVVNETVRQADSAAEHLDDRASSLAATVRSAAQEFEVSTDMLERHSSAMEQRSETASKQAETLRNMLSEQQSLLAHAAENLERRAEEIEGSLGRQTTELRESSEVVSGTVRETVGDLERTTRDLQGATQRASERVREVGDEFRRRIDEVNAITTDAETGVTSVTTALELSADSLSTVSEKVIGEMGRVGEELQKRSDQLDGTSQEASGRVRNATESLATQARDIERITIERVAPTNSRVLISGPPGSGKEIVARLVHLQSRRTQGPFVVLNCANMSPDRVEVELFGEETGDGSPHKVGTFEKAHNGTLFLDEVADMPLETQGKIVRALQEQVFQRIGGTARIEVSVRVVASSTRDLTLELSEGRFREDLYYRLNVVPITVPSLRERRDDIPLLAEFFIEQARDNVGHGHRTIASDAIATMQAYDWPGNVRELRNVVERMLIMAPGGSSVPIGSDMLPAEVTGRITEATNFPAQAEIIGLPLRHAREVFEREYLVTQLDRFDGNISKTAEFVGMERSALHRKLKSLGIH